MWTYIGVRVWTWDVEGKGAALALVAYSKAWTERGVRIPDLNISVELAGSVVARLR